ncbi:hypothetical protein ACJJTC_016339 [Scirpophaga incertulas]
MVLSLSSSAGRRVRPAGQHREVEGEGGTGAATAVAEAALARHARLVAYVRALEDRREWCSVWGEHSYARGGANSGRKGSAVRVLAALPPRSPLPTQLDVVRPPNRPPAPPAPPSPSGSAGALSDDSASDDDAADDNWEERALTLAPSASQAAAARSILEGLTRIRLARLAGGRFTYATALRAEASRARRTVALCRGPCAWLAAALAAARAPAHARRALRRLVAALRDLSTRAADRFDPQPPDAESAREAEREQRARRLRIAGRGVGDGPLLLWFGADRFAKALAPLVSLRVVPLGAARGPPEAWCAGVAAAALARATELAAAAAARGVAVLVGGCGRGAAAARAAAALPGVRGALLLAPALLTADGHREPPLPRTALLVVGAHAAQEAQPARRGATRRRGGEWPHTAMH